MAKWRYIVNFGHIRNKIYAGLYIIDGEEIKNILDSLNYLCKFISELDDVFKENFLELSEEIEEVLEDFYDLDSTAQIQVTNQLLNDLYDLCDNARIFLK